MQWARGGKHYEQSGEGYTVSAVYVRGELAFMAWTPIRATRYLRDGRVFTGNQEHKSRYERGERVPSSSDCLGVFHAHDYSTREQANGAAKAACEAHFSKCEQVA